jgi:uncharacterized protein YndB with AHSA1/START domain
MTQQTVPSILKTITVRASQERAFTVYAEGMGTWWPKEHHIGAADLADVVVEPKEGGRMYERGVDGSECDWGQVLVYDPPQRIVYTWNLQGDWTYDADIAHASEIELRFIAEGPDTTRVELEHRLFERHGDGAKAVHDGVDSPDGWSYTLRCYADVVNKSD